MKRVKAHLIRTAIGILLAASLIALPAGGYAQTAQPPEQIASPYYVVQEGDSLWGIAARFGVGVEELQTANAITNPNQLGLGDRLIIPGLAGVEGEVVTETMPFGETLTSLSRGYGLAENTLIQLNRLSGPNDLFIGAGLILPKQQTEPRPSHRAVLSPGLSILELAANAGVNPWQIGLSNQVSNLWSVLPGDVLRVTGESQEGPGALPPAITGALVEPISLVQGKTVEILLASKETLKLEGNLLDCPLNFFPVEGKGYAALQGLHAMTEPGLYPLKLQGSLPGGGTFSFSQMAPLIAGDYPFDQPLTVDPATIDPAVTKPEDAQWTALAQPVTPERYWNGAFQMPSPLEKEYCLSTGDCWSSRYGNRRSYNGSPYAFFHTGLDIVGRTGTEIFAPADGVVVFAGPLTVRGNATMIDHGQGVYTGYMHQSELLVEAGDTVKAGQLIGRVGGTGRVQGPHLHWEVWVGGVQVDPLDWLQNIYP